LPPGTMCRRALQEMHRRTRGRQAPVSPDVLPERNRVEPSTRRQPPCDPASPEVIDVFCIREVIEREALAPWPEARGSVR
jgi:hypothetical protein